MPITPLSTTPNSITTPSTFNTDMDTHLAELPAFITEANALEVAVNADAAAVAADKITVAANAVTAAAAATAADATANATLWVSAGSYTAGQNRYSPVNFLTYRAITTHSGVATDPSLDATNWVAVAAAVALELLQNSQSAAYTLVLSDSGRHILHPTADTTARTFTIPANASVAFPIGTAVTFVNQVSAGVVTIAITTDTMRLAGPGTTGSRTLAANGICTALKLTATQWIISGTGLT